MNARQYSNVCAAAGAVTGLAAHPLVLRTVASSDCRAPRSDGSRDAGVLMLDDQPHLRGKVARPTARRTPAMPRIRPLLLIALVVAVVACVRRKAVVQQDGLRRLPHIAIAYYDPGSVWFVANDPASRVPSLAIAPFGQQAASALQSLGTGSRFACDLDVLWPQGGHPAPVQGSNFQVQPVYGVENCAELPANCTVANPICGGSCPPCGFYQPCGSASDCTSGYCSAVTPSACAGDVSVSLCIPASCFDGVRDHLETDVDCGHWGCRTGCATGKRCNSNCDCASNNCSGGVCE